MLVLSFDEFEVDPGRAELRRTGLPLKVDALVIDLLVYLANRADELVTHDELITHVWGGRAVSDNVVSVCMAKLRKALGHRRGAREFVTNVYGRGYRFVRPVRKFERRSEPVPFSVFASELSTAPAPRPFVGREPVMARLRAALESAAARQGRVCALLGEPGIGKTRVAEALEQSALAFGARVAWGRSRDLAGAPPLWPWIEVLRDLLRAVSMPSAEAHLGKSFSELARLLPELGAAPDLMRDDAAGRYRTFDAVARLLAFAGEAHAGSAREAAPCVVMLDDLHRADAASLELLSYLVDELPRLPLLIVATLRTTERTISPAEQRHLDYVLGHRNCERNELARLSQSDVAAYTTAILGRADEDLARAVFDRSEGNAFFMTELLRDSGEGALSARGRSLPPAALDLVRQRVRRVNDDAQRILSVAAVLGRSFELALLSSVTQVPACALLERLDDALATEVVVASPDGVGRFAFGHDLIRAVLYDALPTQERAALHLRVAEALSRLEQHGRNVAPAELAHHYLNALPHGDVLLAVEHAVRAADAAMAAAAYEDAAAVLRRALAALDLAKEPAHAVRCSLHYRVSVCLRPVDGPASIAELRRAVAIARENRLPEMLVLAGQAMVRSPGVVVLADGRRVLEDALAGLPEGDHERRALVLSYLSWCAPHCFDREQSAALATKALAHARVSRSKPALIAALRTQLHFGGGPRRSKAETQRLFDEGDCLAEQESRPLRAMWSHQSNVVRAVFALQHGDRAGVDRALDRLGRSAGELQHSELTWHYDRMRVIDRMNHGALREVEPQLRELRERGKRLQLFAYEQVCGNDMLVLLRQTSDFGEFTGKLPPPARPLPQDAPGVLAIKLRAALEMGHRDQARAILVEFAQRGFERLPCERDYLGILSHLAHAAVALEEHAHAGALYALLAPHADCYTAEVSFHTDGSVAHVLGLLARKLEREADAVTHFERAVASNDAFGLPARAAESRVELAATLLQRRAGAAQRACATAQLERAEASARALGMRPLLTRMQALRGARLSA